MNRLDGIRKSLTNARCAHTHYERVLNLLQTYATYGDSHRMILLVGPTGVGKTSLIKDFGKQCLGPSTQWANGTLPFVYTLAKKSDAARFKWSDYYIRLLMTMNEPAIHHKVDTSLRGSATGLNGRGDRSDRAETGLRRSVESALRNRGAEVLVIDEAQHLLNAAGKRDRQSDQLDSAKGIVDEFDGIIILAGVYDLLAMWSMSSEIMRRCSIVEFPRFRDTVGDLSEFKNLLATFDSIIELSDGKRLSDQLEYLWMLSYGCIGLVEKLLHEVIMTAISEKRDRISWANIESFPNYSLAIQRHRADIDRGERFLELFKTVPRSIKMPEQPKPSRGSKRRKPGERNPTSDPAFSYFQNSSDDDLLPPSA